MSRKHNRPSSPAILGKGHAHADKRPEPGELELQEGVIEYDEFKERRSQALQARAISRILDHTEDY